MCGRSTSRRRLVGSPDTKQLKSVGQRGNRLGQTWIVCIRLIFAIRSSLVYKSSAALFRFCLLAGRLLMAVETQEAISCRRKESPSEEEEARSDRRGE